MSKVFEEKVCPLLSTHSTFLEHCKRERCAWFDTYEEKCVIKIIATSLDILVERTERG